MTTTKEELIRIKNTGVGKDWVEISTLMLHCICDMARDSLDLQAENARLKAAMDKYSEDEVMGEIRGELLLGCCIEICQEESTDNGTAQKIEARIRALPPKVDHPPSTSGDGMVIKRLRNQVKVAKILIDDAIGLMSHEQVGQWSGVRSFLEQDENDYEPLAAARKEAP